MTEDLVSSMVLKLKGSYKIMVWIALCHCSLVDCTLSLFARSVPVYLKYSPC